MFHRQAKTAQRARRALVWTLVLIATGQAMAWWLVSHARPELRDPEYTPLITGLKARALRSPGKPVVIILGSSRSAGAIRPSVLPALPGDPVVFNCSTIASGPVRQLQVLRRLLDDGIRPDWLLVEVWSPYLVQRENYFEEGVLTRRDLRLSDWGMLSYFRDLRNVARKQILRNSFLPGVAYRGPILEHFAPDLVPACEPECEWVDPQRRHREDGWFDPPGPQKGHPTGAVLLAIWRERMHAFCDPFVPHAQADRALRDLLGLAARHGAQTALFLAPDHSGLRGPVGMQDWEANRLYLHAVAREHSAPVIDTRDWAQDSDFSDCVHLASRAAPAYTKRFGREVLSALLAGSPLSSSLLLAPTASTPVAGLAQ